MVLTMISLPDRADKMRQYSLLRNTVKGFKNKTTELSNQKQTCPPPPFFLEFTYWVPLSKTSGSAPANFTADISKGITDLSILRNMNICLRMTLEYRNSQSVSERILIFGFSIFHFHPRFFDIVSKYIVEYFVFHFVNGCLIVSCRYRKN